MSKEQVGVAGDGRPRSFPVDRPLSADERQEWMNSWLLGKAVGWEAYGLACAVAAVAAEPEAMRRTLLVESALVHQRCLVEFLVGRVNRKGVRGWQSRDITPAAMCEGWDPAAALPASLVGALDAALADIDALMAHVSRRRARLVRRSWDLSATSRDVLAALDVFVRYLRGVEPFRANCLEAWSLVAREHLKAAGVDLSVPLDVTPASSVLFVVPVGESAGRPAALMPAAEQEDADG